MNDSELSLELHRLLENEPNYITTGISNEGLIVYVKTRKKTSKLKEVVDIFAKGTPVKVKIKVMGSVRPC